MPISGTTRLSQTLTTALVSREMIWVRLLYNDD